MYILFDLHWCLTDISAAVWTHRKITLFSSIFLRATCTFYQRMSHWAEVIWKYHISRKYISDMQVMLYTPDNSCRPVVFLFYSPFLHPPNTHTHTHTHTPFLPVSGIVHVFTSKVIVPDLYDRPLTLRVLVHQHQAENTQGHVWAGPNLALCHSVAVTSNWNALQQITFIPALLGCKSITEGEKRCGVVYIQKTY